VKLLEDGQSTFKWIESPTIEEKLEEVKAFKHWTQRAQYMINIYQKTMELSEEVRHTFVHSFEPHTIAVSSSARGLQSVSVVPLLSHSNQRDHPFL
jgi:hypothetical protein